MLELTRLESNIIRMNFVWNRLVVIYKDFRTLTYNNNYGMKSVAREYAIVQLYNFIKIRDAMLPDFAFAGKHQLDSSLKPLWEPILEQKIPLEKLRNSYYAHMQEGKKPFEEFMEDILAESNYPASFGDTIFLVGCACEYCLQVKANFETEWRDAWKKFKVLAPPHMPNARLAESAVNSELVKLREMVLSNLAKNGLKSDVTNRK